MTFSRLKPVFVAALIVGLNIYIWNSCNLGSYLTFEGIKYHSLELRSFIEHRYWLSILLYILAYITNVALFLPATALMIILGGFLFGALPTVLYALIGATVGATLAFLIARYIVGKSLQRRYHAQLAPFNARITQNMVRYLLFVRIVPIFPFALINILAGLTLIPLATFFWTTAIGIVPNLIFYSLVGEQLAHINGLHDLLTCRFMAPLCMLTIASIVPLIIHYRRSD